MERGFQLKKFINYQWQAKTKYYLHSPFIYRFYLNVIEGNSNSALRPLSSLRARLQHSSRLVTAAGFGTRQQRQVSLPQLERKVAVPHKYGQILYRLVNYFKPATVLELGTSIGLSSAYLALGNPGAKIITMEGCPQIAEIAREHHAALGLKNTQVITGPFEQTLPEQLTNIPVLPMVYFDGNHQRAATLQYFELCVQKANEDSVFIFDDIYWSREMFSAWQQIKQHPRVTITVDIYKMGICFFKKEKLAREDFMLRA